MRTRLREFYDSLPQKQTISPKNDFLMKVANRCGVTFGAVRNWIYYGQSVRKESHREVLSEMTGIPKDQLFDMTD